MTLPAFTALSIRIDHVSDMTRERANIAARKAGLDEMRNVWHNAMISRENGHPWKGVDYSHLRNALRIDRMRYDRLHSLSKRAWSKVTF